MSLLSAIQSALGSGDNANSELVGDYTETQTKDLKTITEQMIEFSLTSRTVNETRFDVLYNAQVEGPGSCRTVKKDNASAKFIFISSDGTLFEEELPGGTSITVNSEYLLSANATKRMIQDYKFKYSDLPAIKKITYSTASGQEIKQSWLVPLTVLHENTSPCEITLPAVQDPEETVELTEKNVNSIFVSALIDENESLVIADRVPSKGCLTILRDKNDNDDIQFSGYTVGDNQEWTGTFDIDGAQKFVSKVATLPADNSDLLALTRAYVDEDAIKVDWTPSHAGYPKAALIKDFATSGPDTPGHWIFIHNPDEVFFHACHNSEESECAVWDFQTGECVE